jgi:hypothetical protein
MARQLPSTARARTSGVRPLAASARFFTQVGNDIPATLFDVAGQAIPNPDSGHAGL